MTRTTCAFLALAILALTPAVLSQAPVAEWTFDADIGNWQSVDPTAQLSVADDANLVREAGNPCAEYSYTLTIGELTGIMTEVPASSPESKCLHFWMRTSDRPILLASLSEGDGSSYMAGLVSLPDRWQEVALDFTDFRLGDDSIDENGKLDPDQIVGVGIIDASGFIAQMAAQVPFIDLPPLGPRMLWLDDMAIETEGVAPRWQVTEVDGARAVRFDSFESTPLQWFVIAGESAVVDFDPDQHADGDFSLRFVYDLPANKLVGLMTDPSSAPLEGMARLRLAVLTENATTLSVGLKEQDESDYSTMIQPQPGDEMQVFDIALSDLQLGDDSTDENGQLDLSQVTEFFIADVSVMAGQPVAYNTLWLDDITFVE